MTNFNSMHVAGCLLTLLMVAAGPANAPTSDVLTLMSPNEEELGHFGNSVAGAGDVNRDGFADLIVGAYTEGLSNAGRAYIFSGQDRSLLFELISPNEQEDGEFGGSVAGAGDVNKDGFVDLIVGAPSEGTKPPLAGRAYVFSGEDGRLLFEFVSPNEESGGKFGDSVAGAGDVNQDGFVDLIVGATYEDPGTSPRDAGRGYVFSGQDGSLLFELISPNEDEDGRFGLSVAGAGDVNGDGGPDVIVGAEQEDPGTSPDYSGRAYVFSAQNGSLLFELVSPNEQQFGLFGSSVAGAADVNEDGFADLVVGARRDGSDTNPTAGRAYVFSGQNGSPLLELGSPNEESGGHFGYSVAGAGDVNQDGIPDVTVGAYLESDPDDTGRAYIFSGQDGSLLFELVSPNPQSSGNFGVSVAGSGDVNQDGVADVVVGAPFESPGSSPYHGGRAYVFLSSGVFRINSGGPNYTDTNGRLFVADRAYAPGGFGYVFGLEHRFSQPIGGTDDDPLYQDVRVVREGDHDGIFAYRFDVASPARYDVTLYLMAPALEGAGNVVMDVKAEGDVVFDDLDVTAEAGGEYQALVKTFAVDVNDGRLDLIFRAVNKAAVVSAIAVAAQAELRRDVAHKRAPAGRGQPPATAQR